MTIRVEVIAEEICDLHSQLQQLVEVFDPGESQLVADEPEARLDPPGSVANQPVAAAAVQAAVAAATGPASTGAAAAAMDASAPDPLAAMRAAATGTVAGPVVDKRGFPWNEQIHARTKTQTADGIWKKKRNVAATLVAAVEEAMQAQRSTPAAVAAPTTAAAIAPPVTAVGGVVATQAQVIDLASRLLTAAGAMGTDPLQQMGTKINAVMIANGLVNGANDLLNRPDLAPKVYTELQAAGTELGITC